MAYNTLSETGPLRVLNRVQVGDGVSISNFVVASECMIGAGSRIGPFAEIKKGVRIGDRCQILGHSSISENIEIGDESVVGQGAVLLGKNCSDGRSDYDYGREGDAKKPQQPKAQGTRIGKRATIGAGALILWGVQIGDGAIIGAGAVVTKDVLDKEIVCGVPARVTARSSWEDL